MRSGYSESESGTNTRNATPTERCRRFRLSAWSENGSSRETASVAPVAGRAPWLPRIGANPLAAGHVVLAPGAGSAEKRWGGWAALAAALHARGIPTLVVPGQDDPFVSLPGPAVPAPGLDGLRALAEGCRAWVGNDTGTTHLAAAAGAQVFAAFGPTDPARWAPRPSRIFGFGADPAALAEEIGRVRVPTGS